MSIHADHAEAGFSLLETVIAFLILSISLAVVVESISRNTLAMRRVNDLQQASLVMEQLSVSMLQSIDASGKKEGKIGKASWKLTSSAIETGGGPTIFALEVQIRPRGTGGPVFDYLTFANRASD